MFEHSDKIDLTKIAVQCPTRLKFAVLCQLIFAWLGNASIKSYERLERNRLDCHERRFLTRKSFRLFISFWKTKAFTPFFKRRMQAGTLALQSFLTF